MRKTAREIVAEAYEKLLQLEPTIEEIQEFADLHKKEYGVVTYSRSREKGSGIFIRLHDTWKQKFGGRIHIDVGYVDAECQNQKNVVDTTHLMLDKTYSAVFVDFLKEKRKAKKQNIDSCL